MSIRHWQAGKPRRGPAGWAWSLAGVMASFLAVQAAADFDVRRDPAVEAVARVMPAVVNIATETLVEVRDPFDSLLREFWGPYYRRRPPTAAEYSLGSGVIVDETGYILTNDHVVRRANRILVRLSDEAGGGEYEAKVIGGTKRSDVAMLKIEPKAGQKLQTVKFAPEDDLLLGETVLALGNPFGLGGSVSRGILSSKSRRPPIENAPLGLEDWLQTDAAINPGSSGGPLVNLRGELIGLSVAVYREGQGIGFAIPVKRVIAALLEISSPALRGLWFGARVRPTETGLVVSSVEGGSPAEKAGLRAGDVLRAVNGKPLRGFIPFMQELSAAGDRTDLAILFSRGGAAQEATVRLVREANVFNAVMIRQRLGMSVQEITPELQEQLGLIVEQGLLVTAVDRDGPAAAAGLQRGYMIVALDGQEVEEVVAVAKFLYGKKKGEKISLDVLSQRQRGAFIIPQRAQVQATLR